MSALLLASLLSVEFVGPCSSEPLLSATASRDQASTVGELTIQTLDRFTIPYLGTAGGLNSAFGTPIGLDALEVLSDSEMRSYGWCYSVDGVAPEVYPHEIALSEVSKIRWFYAFAHYVRGQWVSQCEPAYELVPEFLCGPAKTTRD